MRKPGRIKLGRGSLGAHPALAVHNDRCRQGDLREGISKRTIGDIEVVGAARVGGNDPVCLCLGRRANVYENEIKGRAESDQGFKRILRNCSDGGGRHFYRQQHK